MPDDFTRQVESDATQWVKWQIAFILCTGGGGLMRMEYPFEVCKKGLGRCKGRGEKDCRNAGGGVICRGPQSKGSGLRLKPFYSG